MKLFDEAKIPYPPTSWDDKSWTWDKFVEMAKKLTKNYDDPNTGVYGAGTGELWPKFDAIPLIFGKDHLDAGSADDRLLRRRQHHRRRHRSTRSRSSTT